MRKNCILSQLAKYFDLVLAGEKVFIRRKNKLFTIIPVDDGDVDVTITPELEEKIEKARKEYLYITKASDRRTNLSDAFII